MWRGKPSEWSSRHAGRKPSARLLLASRVPAARSRATDSIRAAKRRNSRASQPPKHASASPPEAARAGHDRDDQGPVAAATFLRTDHPQGRCVLTSLGCWRRARRLKVLGRCLLPSTESMNGWRLRALLPLLGKPFSRRPLRTRLELMMMRLPLSILAGLMILLGCLSVVSVVSGVLTSKSLDRIRPRSTDTEIPCTS